MKKSIFTFLTLTFLNVNSYAMTKTITLPEEKYVTITATLDKDEYADWEPINLKIKIVNKSDKLFIYDCRRGIYNFKTKISASNNPHKVYTFEPYEPWSFGQTSVYPGQFFEYEFKDLNQNIKFPKKQDQEYKVEISIPYWFRNDEAVLDITPKNMTIKGLIFKIIYKDKTKKKQKFIENSDNNVKQKISSTKTIIQYVIETKKEVKVLSKKLKAKLNIKLFDKKQRFFELKRKESKQIFRILGEPNYIAKGILAHCGWLFDDGSILCAEIPFYDTNRDLKLISSYEFYWNKINIPKNVKKFMLINLKKKNQKLTRSRLN